MNDQDECPDCLCCRRLYCYRGEDSDCSYDDNMMRYLCPCTED